VRPPRWLVPLACTAPLAYYVAGAASHPGLYEEGSFVAAARSLGVPHPPGAPITNLATAFAALVPIGPLAFRVAVSSAVCASFTLALFARALFFSLRGVGVGRRGVRAPALLALAGTWFVAQTPLFFSLATRPNVHAVQFAIGLWMIDALVRFELSEPSDDRRPLYLGAFVQGLAFANHHVFALLLLSVAAPTLGRVFARRGFMGLMGHVAAPILGFSAYVYVPIRGGREPFINIGAPDTLTRTFWVVNADPWRGPGDLAEPDALAQLREGLCGQSTVLAVALYGLAAIGLVLAARNTSPRRFALLWSIALAVPLASVAWILEPTVRAEAWGALVPCALALVALATFGLGLGLRNLLRQHAELGSERVGVLASGLALLSLMLHAEPRGQAHAAAPEAIDQVARRSLPTRAVVITPNLESYFRWLGVEAEERLRADLTLLPLAALEYPHMVESLSDEAPELAPVLGEYLRGHQLGGASLDALARKRPVLVELGQGVSSELYPSLAPAGWYERYGGAGVADARLWSDLYTQLGDEIRAPDLSALLVRGQLFQAVAAGSRGQRGFALAHVELGLLSAPADVRLLALRKALGQPGSLSAALLLRLVAERD
jgi:Protein of unknown function (DUF2723)